MSSNVSRTFNLNHLTFAKNTNNELMNAYIKKLYQRMPGSAVGSINTNQNNNTVQLDRYAHHRDTHILSPNLLRKSAKRPMKSTTQSTATMALVKEANTMAIHSPMVKFYNSRRYHSSASTSSTAIVSKRYNSKPRKRITPPRPNKSTDYSSSNLNYYRPAERPKKSSGFHNPELMKIDVTLKQLISLGPQRAANLHPAKRLRSHGDPLTGWNHPPDIRVFAVPSNLANKPMGDVSSQHTHSLNNSFMGRPQKRSLWAAASKNFSSIKKPISKIDFVIRHGEHQVKSLKRTNNSERLIDNAEMIKQERQNQLFRQKTKMLQELLQISDHHHKVNDCSEDEMKPRKRQNEKVARQVTSMEHFKSQKRSRPSRENLRHSIESLSTINVSKPSSGAEPMKLVTKPSELSVLMGTGQQQRLHHLHDRLSTQYRRNYVLQQHEITNNKQEPEKQELEGKHQTAKEVRKSQAPNLELRQVKSMFNLPTKVTASATACILNINKKRQMKLQAQKHTYPHTQQYQQSYLKTYAQPYTETHQETQEDLQAKTTTSARTQMLTEPRRQVPAPQQPKIKTQKKVSETQIQSTPPHELPAHLLQGIRKHGFHPRTGPDVQLGESTVSSNNNDSYMNAIQAAYKKISENSLENLIKKSTKPFNALAGQNRRY